jgi:hypothetical protein
VLLAKFVVPVPPELTNVTGISQYELDAPGLMFVGAELIVHF